MAEEKPGAAEVSTSSSEAQDHAPVATTANGNEIDNGLQRGLKNRHLVMISFGGVVGASIWYGTGYTIAYSGPVGALISFFVIGVDVFFVMQCLGEMATLFPIQGAFIELASRFVDPALGFSLGWNYWYLWVTNVANALNVSSLIMGYWVSTDTVPTYAWILLWWAFYQCTTLLGVVVWGEMEFWFASWKLLCILGGFLCAILLNTGAVGGKYIGFWYYSHPGPIANGIQGFGDSFLLAAVYYCGTEMLAITAAESRDPARDLPKAIRNVFWRILIIFMGMTFFAGIIVPSSASDLLTAKSRTGLSPWTIAFTRAGVPAMGNVVNVVMITAEFASLNSFLYVASRTLRRLATARQDKNGAEITGSRMAPKFFAWTSSNGTPVAALVFSNALGLISMLNYKAGPGQVFAYLIDIAGSATFIAWAVIGVIHIRFRKAWKFQGHGVDELPFKAILWPYGTIFVIFINTFIVIIAGYSNFIGGFDAAGFVVSYIVIAVFLVLYVGWKIVKRTKVVRLEDVDLVTGRKEKSVVSVEGLEAEKKRGPWYVKIKRFVFS